MMPLLSITTVHRPRPPARGAGAVCLGLMLLLLWGPAHGPSWAGQAQKVAWLSYQKALEARQESPRPLVIFFHAPWCYMCRKMKRRVFSRKEVWEVLNRSFLPVGVDVTRQPRLKEEFKVSGLPTMIFLNAQGKPVLRLHGYVARDKLLAALEYVQKRRYRQLSWEKFLETRP